jgi:homoserine kinase
VFGLALQIFNRVEVDTAAPRPRVLNHGPGADALPTNQESLTYRALAAAFASAGKEAPPVEIVQHLRIPLERGLGSSAAAVAAGVRVGAALAGTGTSDGELVAMGLPLEGHPDNLAAALHGGFCVSVPHPSGLEVLRLDFPEEWEVVLLIPEARVPTPAARALLAPTLSRPDAVFNAARCALWVAAVEHHDLALLRTATEDRWHQEARASLFPPLPHLLAVAREAGAAGAALAGAGPAIVAFSGPGAGIGISAALQAAARRDGIPAQALVTRAANRLPPAEL